MKAGRNKVSTGQFGWAKSYVILRVEVKCLISRMRLQRTLKESLKNKLTAYETGPKGIKSLTQLKVAKSFGA